MATTRLDEATDTVTETASPVASPAATLGGFAVRLQGMLRNWPGVVAALAVWELLPRIGILPIDYIPPASTVLATLGTLMAEGAFWQDTARTLAGWAVGLLIAVCTAIPLGLLIGSNVYAYRATRAIIEFLRPIPSVALIPLAILVYGITFEMKLFLVTFASFWPLLISAIYGVQDVDPVARDTARSFGMGRWEIFTRVTLPSAAAYIATGLRISSALAIILAITAELVAGVGGLGKHILLAQNNGATAEMYALIFATGVISLCIGAALSRAERYVLRWHHSHREVQV